MLTRLPRSALHRPDRAIRPLSLGNTKATTQSQGWIEKWIVHLGNISLLCHYNVVHNIAQAPAFDPFRHWNL
jgi:hypothetical protein